MDSVELDSVELDSVEQRRHGCRNRGTRRPDHRSGQIGTGLIGHRILMSLANFFLEPRDEVVGVGGRDVARALVHRGVTPPAQCGEFGFEFVVVEYTWIQHLSIVVPPPAPPREFASIAQ